MHVRWGTTTTTPFLVTNGVKQGGIIWPMLFNVYMDDLSIKLNQSGIGGVIGGHLINYLCYADDLCLITYATEHLLTYNGSKSYSLCFKPKHIKLYAPCFYLNKLEIPKVDQCKYLGRLQCSNNLILSSICKSTVPTYSNIWTWWHDMLIL